MKPLPKGFVSTQAVESKRKVNRFFVKERTPSVDVDFICYSLLNTKPSKPPPTPHPLFF